MIYIELVFNHFHPVQPQLAYTVYSVITFIYYEYTIFSALGHRGYASRISKAFTWLSYKSSLFTIFYDYPPPP